MTETEVERLVVRLTGDGGEYQRMLQQAEVQTRDAAINVARDGQLVEGFALSMQSFAAAAVSSLAALGGKQFLSHALGEFQTAELIGLRLSSILESNSRDVKDLTEDYTDYAVALEKTTTMEDDAVLALLTKAETFKTTGESAKAAVSDAIGLAAITGGSAESLLRLTAAVENNDAKQAMMFARMVPQLRSIKNEAEFVAEAHRLVAIGMKEAEAETHSSSGAMKMLHRDYGNMLEDLGKIVADGIKPVIEGLSNVIKWFRSLDDEMKTAITIIISMTIFAVSLAAALSLAGIIFGTMFAGSGVLIGTLIAAGVAIATWVVGLGGVTEAWKAAQMEADTAWSNIKETVSDFVDQAKQAIANNKDLAVALTATAAALTTVYGAVKLLIYAYSLFEEVMEFLHVQQVIETGLWLAWKTAVVAAHGVVILFWGSLQAIRLVLIAFNAVLGAASLLSYVWTAATALASAASWLWGAATMALSLAFWTFEAGVVAAEIVIAVWTAAVVLAQGATWLWNAALTVMDVLLAPELLIAAGAALGALAITIGVLAVVGGTLAAVLWSVWQAAKSVVGMIASISLQSGPVAAIGDLFSEWGGILHDVFEVMAVDSKLAMKVLKAGFNLAINEVKDLWPPLWEFIKEGFATAWDLAAKQFKFAMMKAKGVVGNMMDHVMDPLNNEKNDAALKERLEKIDTLMGEATEHAKDHMDALVTGFAVTDSDATKTAKAEMLGLHKEVAEAVAKSKHPNDKEDDITNMRKEAEKLKAVLVGSAEAAVLLREYREMLSEESGGGGHGSSGGRGGRGGGGGRGAGTGPSVLTVDTSHAVAQVNQFQQTFNRVRTQIQHPIHVMTQTERAVQQVQALRRMMEAGHFPHAMGEGVSAASATARERRLAEATARGEAERARDKEAGKRWMEFTNAKGEAEHAGRQRRLAEATAHGEAERHGGTAEERRSFETARLEELLKEIRDQAREDSRKPSVTIEPAGIG